MVWFAFYSSAKRHGTNFVATWCICSFSVKILWHELLLMPTSSAISQKVRQWFSCTFSMWSSSIDVEGCPVLGLPSMNLIWNIGSSHNIVFGLNNACCHRCKVSIKFVDNFTETCCSSGSLIFQHAKTLQMAQKTSSL